MKKRHVLVSLVLALAATLAVVALDRFSFCRRIELNGLDAQFKLRKALMPVAPDPRLVLVEIDDYTLRKFGAWPFNRIYHQGLMELLAKENPATVTYDILFTEERKDNPSGDAAFVNAAHRIPNLTTGANSSVDPLVDSTGDPGPTQPLPQIEGDRSGLISFKQTQLPFPALRSASYFGFVNCEPDADGVHRKLPLVVEANGRVFPSLTLQTLMLYAQAAPEQVRVRIGEEIVMPGGKGRLEWHIPIDRQGRMRVNFRNGTEDFSNEISYFDLAKLLREKEQGKPLPPKFPHLADSIVMIGFVAEGLADEGATPIAANGPLVEMHLNAIDNVLKGDFLRPVPTFFWMTALFAIAFAFALTALRVRFWLLLPAGLMFGGGWLIGTTLLFFAGNLWTPSVMPCAGLASILFCTLSLRYFGEEKEKRRIRSIMSVYLSEKIMSQVLAKPENLELGGVRKDVTVLFSDIRGFTTYSDATEPEDVTALLNEYFEVMVEAVFKYDGTLDKFIGDAIMAFWGAPEAQEDHAQRAVRAAIEMRRAIGLFNARRKEKGLQAIECGIGIHSGPALVGNIGSTKRNNYTAIGSTVNLASRLESTTKKFHVPILISEETRKRIGEGFTITDLGETPIAGLSKPERVFGVEEKASG